MERGMKPMSSNEVVTKFKTHFIHMADMVIGWEEIYSNTIEITLNSGAVYVFIYHDSMNWRLLTKDRYDAEMRGELRKASRTKKTKY